MQAAGDLLTRCKLEHSSLRNRTLRRPEFGAVELGKADGRAVYHNHVAVSHVRDATFQRRSLEWKRA